jgi:hypothetical protein
LANAASVSFRNPNTSDPQPCGAASTRVGVTSDKVLKPKRHDAFTTTAHIASFRQTGQ